MTTTSAASIAVSVPAAPIATPMSARTKAGAPLQIFDGSQFVLWEKIAPCVVDAGFLGDAGSCRRVVAGLHDRDDTAMVQIGHRLPRTLLDGVGDRENRQHLLLRRQHGYRPALRLVHLKASLDLGTAQSAFLDQTMVREALNNLSPRT